MSKKARTLRHRKQRRQSNAVAHFGLSAKPHHTLCAGRTGHKLSANLKGIQHPDIKDKKGEDKE